VIEDPYHPGQDIVLVPATTPDVGLLHAYKADKWGNVLTPHGDDRTMAQACETVIVTAEEIVDYNLQDDPRGGHLVPWVYVSYIVHAPRGAHPGGMGHLYGQDEAHIREYMRAATTEEGFRAYLDRYVRGHTEAEYLQRTGSLVAVS
jgi:glutaconate CoA-transferase subunit A